MREVKVARDNYWYFGKLRDFAAFIFGKNLLNYEVCAELEYSPPCSGCNNCYIKRSNESSSLFSWLSWVFSLKKNPGK